MHANPQPTSYSKLHAVNCAGLLANAVGQSIHLSLTHRIREQARSHLWSLLFGSVYSKAGCKRLAPLGRDPQRPAVQILSHPPTTNHAL